MITKGKCFVSLLKVNIKNKGFTLVEIVCSLSIFTFVVLLEIKLLFISMKNMDVVIENGTFYSIAEDSLNFIGDRIKEGQTHEIVNNRLIINKNSNVNNVIIPKQYCIKLESSSIKIVYSTKGYYDCTEVIMEGVDKFQLFEKENLVYIKISKGDKELERCFCIAKK